MPALNNQRHELFAQELAKGKSATQAYKDAGYKDNMQAASNLCRKVYIQTRVKELQERVAVKTEITIESLTRMYLEDRDSARGAHQYAAAKGAVDSLAKLYGLFVDKHEVGRPGDFGQMSDDEIDTFITERERAISGGLSGKVSTRSKGIANGAGRLN